MGALKSSLIVTAGGKGPEIRAKKRCLQATTAGLDIAAKSTKKYLAMSDASLLPLPFSGEVVVDGSSLVVTLRGVERPSLVLLSFAAAV